MNQLMHRPRKPQSARSSSHRGNTYVPTPLLSPFPSSSSDQQQHSSFSSSSQSNRPTTSSFISSLPLHSHTAIAEAVNIRQKPRTARRFHPSSSARIQANREHTHNRDMALAQSMLAASQRNKQRRHRLAEQRAELKSRQRQHYKPTTTVIDVSQTTAASHLERTMTPTVFANVDEVANEVMHLTQELSNYKIQYRMQQRELEYARTQIGMLKQNQVSKIETIQELKTFIETEQNDQRTQPAVCPICQNQDQVRDTLQTAQDWTARRLVHAEKLAQERLMTIERLEGLLMQSQDASSSSSSSAIDNMVSIPYLELQKLKETAVEHADLLVVYEASKEEYEAKIDGLMDTLASMNMAHDKNKLKLFQEIETLGEDQNKAKRALKQDLRDAQHQYTYLEHDRNHYVQLLQEAQQELAQMTNIKFEARKIQISLDSAESRLHREQKTFKRRMEAAKKQLDDAVAAHKIAKLENQRLQNQLENYAERIRCMQIPEYASLACQRRWNKAFVGVWRLLYRRKVKNEKIRRDDDLKVVQMMGEDQGDPMDLVKSGVLSKTLALATSSDAEVRQKAGKVLAEYVETGRQKQDTTREMAEALAAIDMIRTWTMRVHDKEVDPATEQAAKRCIAKAKTDFAAFLPVLGCKFLTTKGDEGTKIVDIIPGTAAAAVGLLIGDIVDQVNSRKTPTQAIFRSEVVKCIPGDECSLRVIREGKYVQLDGLMGARGKTLKQVQDTRRIKSGTVYQADLVDFLEAEEARELNLNEAEGNSGAVRARDVYLFTEAYPTSEATWRESDVYPLLRKENLTWIDAVHSEIEFSQETDVELKKSAKVFLYVVDGTVRGTNTMLEAARSIGTGKKCVLVLTDLNVPYCLVNGVCSASDVLDLNRARACLLDIAAEHGTPCFTNPKTAYGDAAREIVNIVKGRFSLDNLV